MVSTRLLVAGSSCWTSFQGDGGESFESLVGRVDHDAAGFEGGGAEEGSESESPKITLPARFGAIVAASPCGIIRGQA